MRPADRLLFAILVGAVAGVAAGWWFGPVMVGWGWLCDLFLDALKMTILPLVVTAIICGVAPLGAAHSVGRASAITGVFIVASTLVATSTGVIVADILEPGAGPGNLPTVNAASAAGASDTSIESVIRTIISPNLVAAAVDGQILPIMLFALLLALALAGSGARGKPVIELAEGLNDALMRLIGWILYLSPVGIFALLGARFGELGGAGFWREVTSVGRYVVSVGTGLGVHFMTLAGLAALAGFPPRRYAMTLLRALVTAFGTGSSAATLPVAMDCAAQAGVRAPVVRFVLPLRTALNRNGTALYQATVAMFIAQVYGIELSLAQQVIVVITAALAGISTAGVPQHGIVTLVIALTAAHLPAEGIGLIVAVDWFLDRCRTMINVWGNAVGAAIVHRLAGAAEQTGAV